MLSSSKQFLKAYAQDPRTAPLETQQRYAFDAGSIPGQPYYLVGRVLASVAIGTLVYISSTESVNVSLNGVTTVEDGIVFSLCNPAVAGKGIPVGYVEQKPGDTVAIVRLLHPATDVPFGGAVAAALYVVGTDGFPAKLGDSNYPTSGAYAIGVGLGGNKLLLLPGGSAAVGGGALGDFINATPATAIAVVGPSAFDQTIALSSGALNVAGRRLLIEADFAMTASGAGANTATVTLTLPSGALTLASISKSFSGAGTDTYKARVLAVVQTAGATGTLRSSSEVIETGTASVLALASTGSLDLTGSAVVGGTGGAYAGTTTLKNLSVSLR